MYHVQYVICAVCHLYNITVQCIRCHLCNVSHVQEIISAIYHMYKMSYVQHIICTIFHLYNVSYVQDVICAGCHLCGGAATESPAAERAGGGTSDAHHPGKDTTLDRQCQL